ncbi:penicillin-binding transpeptidase domain-containing protein [uncultured Flavonifractor sp.]|uniref:Penicillin-binding protein n=1 Tax=Candidatus Flavonifractor intestinigallinarum TaxID=2838586 RepID=A0A9D2MKF4_9FIRM|nr:penicillin-binding transpeptidase domain-containing protein [uncultured Flavonifractor sp.]HJB79360.1 penicillin-binding protein [Candidatus Flavonifractor intestinigallinarum]
MEGKQFNIRTLIIASLLALLLVGFILVLYNLQIVKGDEYRAASTVKIANTVTVEAARGELLDRYGRSLVSNRATYEITLNSSLMGAEAERNANLLELITICRDNGLEWTDTLPISKDAPFTYTDENALVYTNSEGKVKFSYLGALLDALPLGTDILSDRWRSADLTAAASVADLGEGLTAEEVIDGLRQYFLIDESLSDADARALIGVLYELNLRSQNVKQTEYIFAQDVSIDVISAIKERSLTGVNISATTVRQYNTTSAAHLLGRVGAIQDWDAYKDKGYNMNDSVGINGMEAAFEDYLRGTSGTLIQEMSTSGKVVSESWMVDDETGETMEPEPGNHVMTTLDLRLQEKVEEVLANTIESLADTKEKGAVVVQSVNDGGILAMASYPNYDLSTVYSSTEAYKAVADDPRNPFVNRATSEIYYPGSTFKPLVAIAALEEGLVTPTEKIQDTGALQLPEEEHYPYGDYHPQCWIYRQYRGTHGWENMADALRDSCNIYFYTLGHRLGIEKIDEYAAMFGLGQKTGLELSEEEGYVAGPDTSAMLGQEWYGGNLLSAAIGQDNTKITMLQLSNYIATLVNGGNRYETHLLKTVKSNDFSETVYEYEAQPVETLNLDPTYVEAVKQGMWEVANDEESTVDQYLSNLVVEVGAKTGSAQVSADENANAVFVLFAPYDDPEIVISMVVEGGASGANLASAAGEIVNYYFGSEHTMESIGTENTLIR